MAARNITTARGEEEHEEVTEVTEVDLLKEIMAVLDENPGRAFDGEELAEELTGRDIDASDEKVVTEVNKLICEKLVKLTECTCEECKNNELTLAIVKI